jgi:molybdopterin molybdotransferase
MLSVADARALMLGRIVPLNSETVELSRAHDRTLAEPLIAARDQPPFASSAMDGYALAAADAPRDVTIVGESAAGRAFSGTLGRDDAVRISTGAPLPSGADGVLIQEDAQIEGARLIAANVTAGRHVRPRAGDFRVGDVLLERGRRLDPIAVGLAAGAGAGALSVARRPRVSVFAGGDELAQPGGSAGADQIYESGSFALCGLIEQWGGVPRRAEALPDNEAKIAEAALAASDASDLVVLIGGASVGPHDHARAALESLGVEIIVPKIAVRPGKPTWFGASKRALVLGLPGNAASAIVCAYLFLRPILEAMLGGDTRACMRLQHAPLAAPLAANGPRETYLRARLTDDGRIAAFDDQDSSLMSVMAQSNALILREPNAPAATAGEVVSYLSL